MQPHAGRKKRTSGEWRRLPGNDAPGVRPGVPNRTLGHRFPRMAKRTAPFAEQRPVAVAGTVRTVRKSPATRTRPETVKGVGPESGAQSYPVLHLAESEFTQSGCSRACRLLRFRGVHRGCPRVSSFCWCSRNCRSRYACEIQPGRRTNSSCKSRLRSWESNPSPLRQWSQCHNSISELPKLSRHGVTLTVWASPSSSIRCPGQVKPSLGFRL